MIAALVLAGLMASAPADAGQIHEEHSRLELVARIDGTRLLALNASPRPQLVLIGDSRRDARAVLVVPPFAELEQRFPSGTLEDLSIEVLTRTSEGFHSSGLLRLEALHTRVFDSVWIEGTPGHVHAWGQLDGALKSLAPRASSLTSSATSACNARCAVDPAHVPVITPAGKKKGDAPPRLEKKPLPPL